MLSDRPFNKFREQCLEALRAGLETRFPNFKPESLKLDVPPKPEMGDLGSSISFEVARRLKRDPAEVAADLAEAISVKAFSMVESVISLGSYVNFKMDFPNFASLTINSVRELKDDYGYVKSDRPKKIIVEHTSVNPIHPIHVGQARNPILGDSIARILTARGNRVERHYYIDDVGRQSAIISYSYQRLGAPRGEMKIDHLIGILYAITNCILALRRLERNKEVTSDEARKRKLEDWRSVAQDLKGKYPDLYRRTEETISQDEDPEASISLLMRRYERGDEEAKRLIRRVSELCLEGFRNTLSRLGVAFDSWDWESELIWNGSVSRVIETLESSPYTFWREGVLEFDAEKTARELRLKEALGLNEAHEIPSLTLMRADGTTLYTTRDIAYSLWKLSKADMVINVVGREQSLAQLQMKLALYALGRGDAAKNLIHFSYNLVNLPGYRMSSRRGRYVTLDEVMEEAVKRAFREVSERSPQLPEEEKSSISEMVGIGAIRFALVNVDPEKPVIFTWDRVLDFERNSAPYLQYTYARAGSILRKASREPKLQDYHLLRSQVERDIVGALSRFPEVVIKADEGLKPNSIADYILTLADLFNSFYNSFPVIRAESAQLRDTRLALVEAVRIVMRNALHLMGIAAPERM